MHVRAQEKQFEADVSRPISCLTLSLLFQNFFDRIDWNPSVQIACHRIWSRGEVGVLATLSQWRSPVRIWSGSQSKSAGQLSQNRWFTDHIHKLVAQLGEHLSYTKEAGGSSPSKLIGCQLLAISLFFCKVTQWQSSRLLIGVVWVRLPPLQP